MKIPQLETKLNQIINKILPVVWTAIMLLLLTKLSPLANAAPRIHKSLQRDDTISRPVSQATVAPQTRQQTAPIPTIPTLPAITVTAVPTVTPIAIATPVISTEDKLKFYIPMIISFTPTKD